MAIMQIQVSHLFLEDEAKEKLCQAAVDAFWAAMKRLELAQNKIKLVVLFQTSHIKVDTMLFKT